MEEPEYSVGELAQHSGVTVRTLHHYDALGLLVPSARTDAGYRVYAQADVQRLADILTYRACGIPLGRISALLDADGAGRAALLRQALELLEERTQALVHQREVLLRELEAEEMGMARDPHEKFGVLGDFDPSEYEQEAAERWGETDAFRESQRRTSRYTAEDWLRERTQVQAINEELASCLDAGLPATDERTMAAAEAHRRHIDTWFYPCSYDMQTGLADMYVTDERFTQTYEKVRPGLAAYVRDAIWANAVRNAG